MSGLAGEVLTSHATVGRSEANVEDAISLGSAVIAIDSTAIPARIGTARLPAGTLDLIAGGYTPRARWSCSATRSFR